MVNKLERMILAPFLDKDELAAAASVFQRHLRGKILDIAVFGATSTIAKEYVQTALGKVETQIFSCFSRSVASIQ